VAAVLAAGFALTMGRAMLAGGGVGAAYAGFAVVALAVVALGGIVAPRLLRGRITRRSP
jgi:hypothetical protein